ncbi:hypothetical protein Ait01nite_042540 [Actinoplanes italicus]|nr:hypothetical protein Ait01nite_042540 [Actinoplanes italicus]
MCNATVCPCRAKLRARLRPITARPVTPICAFCDINYVLPRYLPVMGPAVILTGYGPLGFDHVHVVSMLKSAPSRPIAQP